jgi:hypothetical protein
MTSEYTDTTDQSIQSIQDLQKLEEQLYARLEQLSANGNKNNLEEQTSLVKQINDLSATRINLFNTLNNLYNSSQNNLSSSKKLLADKLLVAQVMEEQLNTLKMNLNVLQEQNNNKLRMVQINTYFGKKYKAYTELMKIIIIMFIIIIIFSIISKFGFIPKNINMAIITLIFLIGIIFILRKIWDISTRDNMNFDEYNWNKRFTPSNNNVSSDLGSNSLFDGSNNSLFDGNLWNMCGDGTNFDSVKKQCVISSPNNSTENFSLLSDNNITGYNKEKHFYNYI